MAVQDVKRREVSEVLPYPWQTREMSAVLPYPRHSRFLLRSPTSTFGFRTKTMHTLTPSHFKGRDPISRTTHKKALYVNADAPYPPPSLAPSRPPEASH